LQEKSETHTFFAHLAKGSMSSTLRPPIVVDMLEPESVIDAGCGGFLR
jgi:hypothetical protein